MNLCLFEIFHVAVLEGGMVISANHGQANGGDQKAQAMITYNTRFSKATYLPWPNPQPRDSHSFSTVRANEASFMWNCQIGMYSLKSGRLYPARSSYEKPSAFIRWPGFNSSLL